MNKFLLLFRAKKIGCNKIRNRFVYNNTFDKYRLCYWGLFPLIVFLELHVIEIYDVAFAENGYINCILWLFVLVFVFVFVQKLPHIRSETLVGDRGVLDTIRGLKVKRLAPGVVFRARVVVRGSIFENYTRSRRWLPSMYLILLNIIPILCSKIHISHTDFWVDFTFQRAKLLLF